MVVLLIHSIKKKEWHNKIHPTLRIITATYFILLRMLCKTADFFSKLKKPSICKKEQENSNISPGSKVEENKAKRYL